MRLDVPVGLDSDHDANHHHGICSSRVFSRGELGTDVVADVAAAFGRYEQALADGDVAVLTELFWDDARCVRFGVADRQQGSDEIAAWRREHPTLPAGRRLSETRVLAVDDRTAVVTTLFGYAGGRTEGRQSQTWVRFTHGWRIVAAHVSEVPLG